MSKYIDRELALSFMYANGKYDHEHANQDFIFGCESYKEWLEQLPYIEIIERKGPEKPHWTWIPRDLSNEEWKCSECGTVSDKQYPECPHCHAVMDLTCSNEFWANYEEANHGKS